MDLGTIVYCFTAFRHDAKKVKKKKKKGFYLFISSGAQRLPSILNIQLSEWVTEWVTMIVIDFIQLESRKSFINLLPIIYLIDEIQIGFHVKVGMNYELPFFLITNLIFWEIF